MKKTSDKVLTAGKGDVARQRRAKDGAEPVNRKLVGVRIEPRLVKVMKAVAELHDCALGELVERVFWASMEGQNFFAERGKMSPEVQSRLESLKAVYGVDYDLDYLNGSKGGK